MIGQPRAAPAWRGVIAQAVMELRLALRRGESLVVSLLLPAAVLLFFGGVPVLPVPLGRLVPSAIAIAIVATGLVSLGITTAFDRQYGVLKRLGGSPLPRFGVVAAKLLAIAVIEAFQVGLLLAIAVLALGWRPGPGANVVLAVLAIGLGTAAFAGLGLALAGALRAEATLAVANGLFVFLLLAGGMLVPVEVLPSWLAAVAGLLPSAALADALAIGLGVGGGPDPGVPLGLLAVWGAMLASLAAVTFRWE